MLQVVCTAELAQWVQLQNEKKKNYCHLTVFMFSNISQSYKKNDNTVNSSEAVSDSPGTDDEITGTGHRPQSEAKKGS